MRTLTEIPPVRVGWACPRSLQRSPFQHSLTGSSGEKPTPLISTDAPGGPEDGVASRLAAPAGGAVTSCTARVTAMRTVMNRADLIPIPAPRLVIAIATRLPRVARR